MSNKSTRGKKEGRKTEDKQEGRSMRKGWKVELEPPGVFRIVEKGGFYNHGLIRAPGAQTTKGRGVLQLA